MKFPLSCSRYATEDSIFLWHYIQEGSYLPYNMDSHVHLMFSNRRKKPKFKELLQHESPIVAMPGPSPLLPPISQSNSHSDVR